MKFPQSVSLLLSSVLLATIRAQTDDGQCCENPKCVQETIQTIVSNLSTGVNVNGQDLSIRTLVYPGPFSYTVKIPGLRFNLTTTENVFRGLAGSTVSDARVTHVGSDAVIFFNTFTPHLTHTADYVMVGAVDSLTGFGAVTLNNTGSCVFGYNNTEIKHRITLSRTSQNGEEVLRVKSYRAGFHAAAITAKYSNLFNGQDEIRADAFGTLITENVFEIVTQIAPDINCAYSRLFGRLARLLLNGRPIAGFCLGEATSL